MQSGEHAPASSGTSGGGEAGRPRGAVGTVVEVRILSGARSGEQMYFFDAQKVRIGRNLTSDVVLPDPGVSRHHAELARAGTGYVARDVGSTAGTFVLPSGERLDGLVLEPTAGAPAAAGKPAPPPAVPGATGSIDLSIGQIGHGPRCRIGVGLSVPFGRYVLTGRLGGGGMAEVFMARQTGLGGMFRQVALKLIQPEMWSLVDAGAMFLDEARIAADINHHNVVKIYDVGEQDGVLFLAMEYLRGVTVSNLAAQLGQRGERLPPELVAAIIGQACAGLHAAHQLRDMSGRLLNVVHRDVSPSNLMVLPEGLVKVIDFGVARADTRLHQAEEGLQGKPAYMSPEQVQSQPLDCRSDLFALGVVLYELCSGQPLFYREDTVATFYAVVRGEVPPLRSVCPWASPHLEAVVHRALAKLPEQRFQSAAELGAELDQVVAEGGGRFSSIAAISRFLTERGVSLTGTPPALLTQIPKALYADSGRVQKAAPRELFDSHDKLPVNPAAGAAAHSTSGAVPGPAPDALNSPPPRSGPPLSRSPLSGPPPAGPAPSRPPMSGPPLAGLPLSRPPMSGPPPAGPPPSRPPLSGPPLAGPPPSQPPLSGRSPAGQPLSQPPLFGPPPVGQPLSQPPLSGPPLSARSPVGQPLSARSPAGVPSGSPLVGGLGSQPPGTSRGRRSLAGEPQRLLGLVLAGRCRLQRYLSRTPKAGQPLVKLTYQATLLTDGPEEIKARAAGRLQGDQVIV
ncbi:MAG TPA: protein kinase, partial [Pseudomonadota bacterium]|nr:protein kinase [Pseudomonadota bacterium]